MISKLKIEGGFALTETCYFLMKRCCRWVAPLCAFFGRNFLSASRKTPRRQRTVVRFGGNCSPGLCAGCGISNRCAALLPSQKRGTSAAFGLRLVCRVSIPGPRERGPGFKTRGNAGFRWSPPDEDGVWFRVVRAFLRFVLPQHREVGCSIVLFLRYPLAGVRMISKPGQEIVWHGMRSRTFNGKGQL